MNLASRTALLTLAAVSLAVGLEATSTPSTEAEEVDVEHAVFDAEASSHTVDFTLPVESTPGSDLHLNASTSWMPSLFSEAYAGTPRRPPGSYVFGPSVKWTDGTTTEIFQPLSDPLPSSQLVQARIYLEIDQATNANLRSRPALRYSADGVSWDPAQPINTSYVTGAGTQAGTTFVDLTGLAGVTPKAWLQFGVQVKNNTAGVYELANYTLIVEPKGN